MMPNLHYGENLAYTLMLFKRADRPAKTHEPKGQLNE